MTKFHDKTFTVGFTSADYRSNFERTFGKKEDVPTSAPDAPSFGSMDPDAPKDVLMTIAGKVGGALGSLIKTAVTHGQAVQLARTCHAVNAAYCEAIGETGQVPWEDAPPAMQASVIAAVKAFIEKPCTPRELNRRWYDEKVAAGWKYGPVKSWIEQTHPCLLPYDDLPQDQKVKDYLFAAVINSRWVPAK